MVYINSSLNVEAKDLLHKRLIPECHLLYIVGVVFQLLLQPDVDLWASSHANKNQHYYKPETLLPQGGFALKAFLHPQDLQVSYTFPPAALVPIVVSKFLAEHVTDQSRH